jgi:hypothetical protein
MSPAPRLIDPAAYVTVGTAAALAGVSRFWMRETVKAGRLPGVEIDGIWLVERAAAAAFERHPTAGRPRKDAAAGGAKRPRARKRSS